MATIHTAGTEIIRCIHLKEVDATTSVLIFGEQHHIYTVLSAIIYCHSKSGSTNYVQMRINGYDSKAGGDATSLMNIFKEDIAAEETFVWNDKFSFNGHEPADFTGPMDDATKQNAIADQAQATAQLLKISTENASDGFDITCTFIDQNNA